MRPSFCFLVQTPCSPRGWILNTKRDGSGMEAAQPRNGPARGVAENSPQRRSPVRGEELGVRESMIIAPTKGATYFMHYIVAPFQGANPLGHPTVGSSALRASSPTAPLCLATPWRLRACWLRHLPPPMSRHSVAITPSHNTTNYPHEEQSLSLLHALVRSLSKNNIRHFPARFPPFSRAQMAVKRIFAASTRLYMLPRIYTHVP